MAQHNELGAKGETLAVDYLYNKGYRIVEKNWVCCKNEIDIIVEDEDFIVFVEVKTRSNGNWGNPEESVSRSKINRIIEASHQYLTENDIDKPARFDVISIIINGNSTRIDHFEDAFLAPLNE